MSMVGGQAAAKPILTLLLYGGAVAVAFIMLLTCSAATASVNRQQSMGQCLGRCGQDAFACITGCASEGPQDIVSCVGCLTTCAAHIPAQPPSKTPTPPHTKLA